MDIKIDPDQYKNKEGVLVSASHLKEQTFLYLVKGARISFEGQPETIVPWGKPKFIELEAGTYDYEIWFNYVGAKTGKHRGCIEISEASTLLLEYKAPYLMIEGGEVQISNIHNGQLITNC